MEIWHDEFGPHVQIIYPIGLQILHNRVIVSTFAELIIRKKRLRKSLLIHRGATMHSNSISAKTVDRRINQISKIKSKLLVKGITLASIDKDYRLTDGTARNTLREPNAKGERAIAAALGTRPELLWRDRYHASGQRKSPQNYDRPPTMAQRQIGERKSA